MAVAMTEKNLKKLESLNKDLETYVNKWSTMLSDIEKSLKDNTGKKFKEDYSKGKEACTKIQKLVDIFQSEKKEMKSVIKKVNTFITTQRNANKK